MALQQDVSMSERAVRVEAHHVDGADPSLAYVAMYVTEDTGQWLLYKDWTFGPFDGASDRVEMYDSIDAVLSRLWR